TALPPFDHPQVCAALEHALPYDEIGAFLSTSGHASACGQDQRLARGLLREAGYGAGFRFSLFVPEGFADLRAVAGLIQRASMKLDLKVVIEELPAGAFAQRKASRQLPLYIEERSPVAWARGNEPAGRAALRSVILARAPVCMAARVGVEGLVQRPDGYPRYAELRKG
ncbi:MAG: hypothetical protein KGJ86_07245, partial [Chloroflexota bacterium]|nr:hypothetical protein [Chloroflexota bacterium]